MTILTMVRRFRWAACQLDTIAQCVTPGKVRRALQDLPKTLEETYGRILRTIDEGQNAEEALKILTWLTYAARPLTVVEALEVTGIFAEGISRFDGDEVLRDSHDILRICPSLVSIFTSGKSINTTDNDYDDMDDLGVYEITETIPETEYVRLAHFSVKEYLVSSRLCIERYSLQYRKSHDILANHCLVYLLRFKDDEWQLNDCELNFRLARYAARFWTHHARISDALSQQHRNLSMELLTPNSKAFETWTRFYDLSGPWTSTPNVRRRIKELPSPLFAACQEGLTHAVCKIVDDALTDINEQWKDKGNTLYVASLGGYEKIVEILLMKGANVDAEGG
jgi:hypothetical protein